MNLWSGRADALANEYIYQIIQPLDLNHPPSKKLSGYALLGFESDTGVSRNLGNRGASEGPQALRQAFAKLPLHTAFQLFDAGNVGCLNDDLEAAQTELKQRVADILALGLTPLVIGGGHETAWGHFQGLSTQQKDIAIFNLDAHFDLRPQTTDQAGSSGTPFRQIKEYLDLNHMPFNYYCAGIQPFSNTARLFEYAKNQNVTYLLAEDIHDNPNDLTFVERIIDTHEHIYVSVCLDVFNAAVAPGVSAPQPLGIDPNYALKALRKLKQSGKVISLDIVELAPPYDLNNQTAKLAASLLLNFLTD
ncbi:MAG: formimidoylglutamase [Gammaproteobacteria bacterium]|nr:formimidoylglutamase [Gammaproteobacteria bacterium]